MIKKEWKDLLRELKNDKQFPYLQIAYKDYARKLKPLLEKSGSLQSIPEYANFYTASDFFFGVFVANNGKEEIKQWLKTFIK